MNKLWIYMVGFMALGFVACSDNGSGGGGSGGGKVEDAVEGTWLQVGELFFEPDTAIISEERVHIPMVISGTGVTMQDGIIEAAGHEAGEYQLLRDTLWVDMSFGESVDGVIDTTEATPYVKIK